MAKGLAEAAKGLEPKIVKISEELSCELNEVEWQNRARELADAHKEVAFQEQRKKDIMKELGHDVAMAKTKESKLADTVATSRELRDVTVEVKYDYELGTVTKMRTDTNEVISTREMTDSERQAELDFHDANDVIEEGRAAERAEEEISDEEAEQELADHNATDEEADEDGEPEQGEDETPADEPDTTDQEDPGDIDPEAESEEDDDDDWDLGDDEEESDGEEPKA